MRISDWSSDVCSSDLVEFVQRREIGKVERIAFVIGEADPVIDRDDELLRMIWFGRGERIVRNGDGYGGRLDHLVYRCKARRLAEHHVGRANIEAIPSLRPDDAVQHIAAEYPRIRNLDRKSTRLNSRPLFPS